MPVILGNTVWDAALEAVAARLETAIPQWPGEWGDAPLPIETDRRADVSVAEMPRLLVRQEGDEPAEDSVLGETLYRITISVTGYLRAYDGEQPARIVRQSLNALRGAVIRAVMEDWAAPEWIEEIVEGAGDTQVYEAEQSAPAAGEFTARFVLSVPRLIGSPFVVGIP